MMMSAFFYTNTFSATSLVQANWNNNLKVDMLLSSDILSNVKFQIQYYA